MLLIYTSVFDEFLIILFKHTSEWGFYWRCVWPVQLVNTTLLVPLLLKCLHVHVTLDTRASEQLVGLLLGKRLLRDESKIVYEFRLHSPAEVPIIPFNPPIPHPGS